MKRSLLALLLGVIFWSLCTATAVAAEDSDFEIRFDTLTIQDIYQCEDGSTIRPEKGESVSIPQSTKIIVTIIWNPFGGADYGPLVRDGDTWGITVTDSRIKSNTVESVTVRLQDDGQPDAEYPLTEEQIQEALEAGGGRGLIFHNLVLENIHPIDTGTLEITTDFTTEWGGLGECPSGYILTVIPRGEFDWFKEIPLLPDTEDDSLSWTLNNLPVGNYVIYQESYEYDDCTAIPAITGNGGLQPDGGYAVEIQQGDTAAVNFENTYVDGRLGALSLKEDARIIKDEEQITVTCQIDAELYDEVLFPSIRAYLASSDGKIKLYPSSRLLGTSSSEAAATFSFTLPETASNSIWNLILMCDGFLSDPGAPAIITIPDFTVHPATIVVRHHYGGISSPETTVTQDPAGTLEHHLIQEQGTNGFTYLEGRKKAVSWSLFDIDGHELKSGGISNSEFSAVDVQLEAGKTYQLDIEYDTLYQIQSYLETDQAADGTEKVDGKQYLPEAAVSYYSSCSIAFQLPSDPQAYDGYHFNRAETGGQLTDGKILEDGSTIIKLFYDKNEAESSTVPETESTTTEPENSYTQKELPYGSEDHWESSANLTEEAEVSTSEAEISLEVSAPSLGKATDKESVVKSPPKTKGVIYRMAVIMAAGALLLIILYRRKE